MPKVQKVCVFCGSNFSVSPYRTNTAKFCSLLCKTTSTRGVPANISDSKREKMSKLMKLRWETGEFKSKKPWNTGTKGVMVAWNKGLKGFLSGSKHYNWQGGKSKSQWKKDNKDKVNHHTRTRRYKLRGADGNHTLAEWTELKNKYENKCLCCSKEEPEITLTEDHVIPIFLKGTNYISNIQPLCKSCNSKKHTKIIDYRINFK